MTHPTDFDPNAPAQADAGIYGLPHSFEEAKLVFLPVPWEATTSYGGGTSEGPAAILDASFQVDLHDLDVTNPWKAGFFMQDESDDVHAWNEEAKAEAAKVIEAGGDVEGDDELEDALARVNALGAKLNAFVEAESAKILAAGKILGIVGGDHSVPLGGMKALAARTGEFGILHIDAHSDTRNAYEGFEFSHASIMHNVLTRIPEVTKLVQVGIRDVCDEEMEFVASQGKRVHMVSDRALSRAKMEGTPFATLARAIVKELPQKVWVSFDIDGLDPRFCPHTGTPVPGGLDFQEAVFLLGEIVRAGKTIVAFDLNEVAPNLADEDDEWDANVGARMLYKLAGFTLASQGFAKLVE